MRKVILFTCILLTVAARADIESEQVISSIQESTTFADAPRKLARNTQVYLKALKEFVALCEVADAKGPGSRVATDALYSYIEHAKREILRNSSSFPSQSSLNVLMSFVSDARAKVRKGDCSSLAWKANVMANMLEVTSWN